MTQLSWTFTSPDPKPTHPPYKAVLSNTNELIKNLEQNQKILDDGRMVLNGLPPLNESDTRGLNYALSSCRKFLERECRHVSLLAESKENRFELTVKASELELLVGNLCELFEVCFKNKQASICNDINFLLSSGEISKYFSSEELLEVIKDRRNARALVRGIKNPNSLNYLCNIQKLLGNPANKENILEEQKRLKIIEEERVQKDKDKKLAELAKLAEELLSLGALSEVFSLDKIMEVGDESHSSEKYRKWKAEKITKLCSLKNEFFTKLEELKEEKGLNDQAINSTIELLEQFYREKSIVLEVISEKCDLTDAHRSVVEKLLLQRREPADLKEFLEERTPEERAFSEERNEARRFHLFRTHFSVLKGIALDFQDADNIPFTLRDDDSQVLDHEKYLERKKRFNFNWEAGNRNRFNLWFNTAIRNIEEFFDCDCPDDYAVKCTDSNAADLFIDLGKCIAFLSALTNWGEYTVKMNGNSRIKKEIKNYRETFETVESLKKNYSLMCSHNYGVPNFSPYITVRDKHLIDGDEDGTQFEDYRNNILNFVRCLDQLLSDNSDSRVMETIQNLTNCPDALTEVNEILSAYVQKLEERKSSVKQTESGHVGVKSSRIGYALNGIHTVIEQDKSKDDHVAAIKQCQNVINFLPIHTSAELWYFSHGGVGCPRNEITDHLIGLIEQCERFTEVKSGGFKEKYRKIGSALSSIGGALRRYSGDKNAIIPFIKELKLQLSVIEAGNKFLRPRTEEQLIEGVKSLIKELNEFDIQPAPLHLPPLRNKEAAVFELKENHIEIPKTDFQVDLERLEQLSQEDSSLELTYAAKRAVFDNILLQCSRALDEKWKVFISTQAGDSRNLSHLPLAGSLEAENIALSCIKVIEVLQQRINFVRHSSCPKDEEYYKVLSELTDYQKAFFILGLSQCATQQELESEIRQHTWGISFAKFDYVSRGNISPYNANVTIRDVRKEEFDPRVSIVEDGVAYPIGAYPSAPPPTSYHDYDAYGVCSNQHTPYNPVEPSAPLFIEPPKTSNAPSVYSNLHTPYVPVPPSAPLFVDSPKTSYEAYMDEEPPKTSYEAYEVYMDEGAAETSYETYMEEESSETPYDAYMEEESSETSYDDDYAGEEPQQISYDDYTEDDSVYGNQDSGQWAEEYLVLPAEPQSAASLLPDGLNPLVYEEKKTRQESPVTEGWTEEQIIAAMKELEVHRGSLQNSQQSLFAVKVGATDRAPQFAS